MKQRLGIAGALLMPRDLLILDEPSNGLDPQGTREVRSLIGSLANEGATIFVSSHLLSEIEQMCSHVAVMSAGRLVAQGPLDELRQQGVQRLRVDTLDTDDALRVLTRLGLSPTASGSVVTAEVPRGGLAPERLNAALVEGGVGVRGFAVAGASLEDRFVDLTGEGFDVAG
jgi:ABC-type multidrug transport system ATPase subunit